MQTKQCMQYFCREAHLYGMLLSALTHHVCCVLFNGLTRKFCITLLADGPSCASHSDILSLRYFIHPYMCLPLKPGTHSLEFGVLFWQSALQQQCVMQG